MVDLNWVEAAIRAKLPDADVKVEDLTGGGDHLQATVVSATFEGKPKVKQHQLVYSALREAMDSEAIHALALKTYTPQTWQQAGQ
ncbi:MAG: BolA family transcriptional regulator [Spirulinaceae cyanobacterium RM2_2_10]|nr:BolA family transcriptional regulator [Spirulinaceae cyanobacterium SM2_1_0]NJO20085.1 BolA family transcriptional regulator [Spirulinaceae cyanobacterium RM2_2_10]